MAKKKRHAADEIAVKLREADALITAGRSHSEIAKALGISIMTFYRWRKARAQQPNIKSPQDTARENILALAPASAADRAARIAELQVENGRLRKLVTDLLLEKMRLEDERTGKSRVS